MLWYEALRVALYVLWAVMALLTVKLLVTRQRWRHPLRGNGPMLWALLITLLNTEIARARSIGTDLPPPFLPALLANAVATVLIMYWLWRQMELIPRWLRAHVPWRRTGADYTIEEHTDHASDQQ